MTPRTLRIALVEPYLGGSHQAWADGYAAHSSHDVEVFGLPAIHWKWRMQGGHVSLAAQIESAVAERGPFDVVLASSMTDVAGLLGVARHRLSGARVVLYMHENQLTFPRPEHDRDDLTYAMTNWTSMVAADHVVFNSEYHRGEWFDALPQFLRRLPDHRHTALIAEVRDRTSVLPVGVDLGALDTVPRQRGVRPVVLWNQRWEYDKGPAEFATALAALVADGREFDVVLLGDRPGDEPPDLVRLRTDLGDRLLHDGWVGPDGYRRLLRSADVVVSTAHHEFFGVAITEAVYGGAFPILPNRLVYPERIPVGFHATCLYDTGGRLLERLRWALDHRDEAARVADRLRPAMAAADWPSVAVRYDRVMGAS